MTEIHLAIRNLTAPIVIRRRIFQMRRWIYFVDDGNTKDFSAWRLEHGQAAIIESRALRYQRGVVVLQARHPLLKINQRVEKEFVVSGDKIRSLTARKNYRAEFSFQICQRVHFI